MSDLARTLQKRLSSARIRAIGGFVHNNEPLVFTVPNYLSDSECDHFRDLSKKHRLESAKVSGCRKNILMRQRNNKLFWLGHHESPVLSAISGRIARLVDIPLEHAEIYQVLRYGVDEEYQPHFDGFDPQTESGRRDWSGGGQRLVTALCYLNDVSEGGGTTFPDLGLEIQAEAGKLVVFHNCFPGTNTRHPLSLHGGSPVRKGIKWAFNLWFRQAPRTETVPFPKVATPFSGPARVPFDLRLRDRGMT